MNWNRCCLILSRLGRLVVRQGRSVDPAGSWRIAGDGNVDGAIAGGVGADDWEWAAGVGDAITIVQQTLVRSRVALAVYVKTKPCVSFGVCLSWQKV